MKREEVKKNPIPPRHNVIKYVGDIIEFRSLEQVCKDVGIGKIHYTGVEEYLWEEVKRSCDEFLAYINGIRENDNIGNINSEYKNAFLNSLKNNLANVIRRIFGSFVIDEVRRGLKPDRRKIEVQGDVISSRLMQKSTNYVEGQLFSGENYQKNKEVTVIFQGCSFGDHNSLTNYFGAVDRLDTVAEDIKQRLKEAREAIESADLYDDDKSDVVEQLKNLTAELEKPEKDTSRVQRYWSRIKEVSPTAASILSSASNLAKILGV